MPGWRDESAGNAAMIWEKGSECGLLTAYGACEVARFLELNERGFGVWGILESGLSLLEATSND